MIDCLCHQITPPPEGGIWKRPDPSVYGTDPASSRGSSIGCSTDALVNLPVVALELAPPPHEKLLMVSAEKRHQHPQLSAAAKGRLQGAVESMCLIYGGHVATRGSSLCPGVGQPVVIAFPSPDNAMAFCASLQQMLVYAEWDQEVSHTSSSSTHTTLTLAQESKPYPYSRVSPKTLNSSHSLSCRAAPPASTAVPAICRARVSLSTLKPNRSLAGGHTQPRILLNAIIGALLLSTALTMLPDAPPPPLPWENLLHRTWSAGGRGSSGPSGSSCLRVPGSRPRSTWSTRGASRVSLSPRTKTWRNGRSPGCWRSRMEGR